MDWQIIGHENAVSFLDSCLESRNLAQTYAFAGPTHVGKGAVARRLAQFLMCFEGSACSKCHGCDLERASNHPDLVWVGREEGKKNIGIEQVRGLGHKMRLGNAMAGRSLAVIDQAHLLSVEAGNSLLKLLEEPRGNATIVLIAPNRDLLLPTIASRAQILNFSLVPNRAIYKALIARGTQRNLADSISSLCMGKPGIALGLAGDDRFRKGYESRVALLFDIMNGTVPQRLQAAKGIIDASSNKDDRASRIMSLLDVWMLAARDILLCKQGMCRSIANAHIKDRIESMARLMDMLRVLGLIGSLGLARRQIGQNANQQLVLENLFLKIG